MRVQRYFMFYLMALLVSGCAQLGLPQAESFSERLAAGYALNAQLRRTATDLLTAKRISSADGQNVLEQTNNTRAGLDIARDLAKTDTKSADGKLTAVRSALVGLQAYLALRKGN